MRKLSVIWDITAFCPWNCAICCMSATSNESCTSAELTQREKLDVVIQLAELNEKLDVRVDLSGGELLFDPFHLNIIRHVSDVLGKDKVGVSTSGFSMTEDLADFLAVHAGDVEMTMDVVPGQKYRLRPEGYHRTAARAVPMLKKAGVRVGLQTVVCKENFSEEYSRPVFEWCCDNRVDEWSILRFFTAGRGASFAGLELTDAECAEYVGRTLAMVNSSEREYKPGVDFHYSMPGHSKYTTECRCVKKSVGILPNGDVTACFWALDSCTGIIDPKYLLGNVRRERLADILENEKARYWLDCPHTCELCA